jgi:tetratricopeptide (TPR) repeat protein
VPLEVEDRYRLAAVYAAEKDFAAAEAQCRAALKDKPDDRKALRQLADVLSWKKDYTEALDLFEKLSQSDPADAELRLRLAEVLLWKGEYGKALPRFQALLEANFDQPVLWRDFVDAAASGGPLSPEQARLAGRIADQAARGEPKDATLLARLAWVLYRLKQADRAGALIDQAAALQPEDPAARKELAGVLAALGRTKPALRLYEGLTLTADDHLSLAGLYAADQDFDAAEAQCRAVLKERPDDRKALRQLAGVLTWKKDYAQALALMKKLAEADPTDAEMPLRLAELMLWSGDYEQALERFQGLLEVNFDQPGLWHAFVDAAASTRRLTAGQKALTVRIYDKVTKAESKDAAFLGRLAWLLYRAKESAKATELLEQAVALGPQEPGVRKELAGTLAAVGEFREALRMYEGLTLDLDDRYHLVGVYATARLKCREILDEDPDDRSARKQLDYVLGWTKTAKESVELLQKLAGESPDDGQLQVHAAEVTLWSAAYEDALKRFGALLNEQFDQPDLWRPYIDAAASSEGSFTTGQAQTIERLRERLGGAENKAEYLSRLAWVMLRLKETSKGEKLLDRALALKPEEPTVRRELAGVLAAAGRHEEARRLYDGLKLTFADRYRLAEIDLAAGQYESAEKRVNEILQARPDDFRGQLLLAAVLSGTRRGPEAARLYRKLQRENPDDRTIPARLAELALGAGDYDNALTQFQDLLDRDPDEPALWAGYVDAAASASRLGDKVRPTAVRIYESLRERKSSDATLLTRLAWVLRRVKEADRSIALLEKALALEPTSRATRRQLAETLYEKGDYAEAEKHYQILLKSGASR